MVRTTDATTGDRIEVTTTDGRTFTGTVTDTDTDYVTTDGGDAKGTKADVVAFDRDTDGHRMFVYDHDDATDLYTSRSSPAANGSKAIVSNDVTFDVTPADDGFRPADDVDLADLEVGDTVEFKTSDGTVRSDTVEHVRVDPNGHGKRKAGFDTVEHGDPIRRGASLYQNGDGEAITFADGDGAEPGVDWESVVGFRRANADDPVDVGDDDEDDDHDAHDAANDDVSEGPDTVRVNITGNVHVDADAVRDGDAFDAVRERCNDGLAIDGFDVVECVECGGLLPDDRDDAVCGACAADTDADPDDPDDDEDGDHDAHDAANDDDNRDVVQADTDPSDYVERKRAEAASKVAKNAADRHAQDVNTTAADGGGDDPYDDEGGLRGLDARNDGVRRITDGDRVEFTYERDKGGTTDVTGTVVNTERSPGSDDVTTDVTVETDDGATYAINTTGRVLTIDDYNLGDDGDVVRRRRGNVVAFDHNPVSTDGGVDVPTDGVEPGDVFPVDWKVVGHANQAQIAYFHVRVDVFVHYFDDVDEHVLLVDQEWLDDHDGTDDFPNAAYARQYIEGYRVDPDDPFDRRRVDRPTATDGGHRIPPDVERCPECDRFAAECIDHDPACPHFEPLPDATTYIIDGEHVTTDADEAEALSRRGATVTATTSHSGDTDF